MTVPGIGPIISTATVAAIGNGSAFSKGRDFGAWLGLVPRQMSTGDRTILGKISRQGNRYLLADAGTEGGTLLNGQRIAEPSPLRDGDRIQMGNCVLTFGERRRDSAPAPAVLPAG